MEQTTVQCAVKNISKKGEGANKLPLNFDRKRGNRVGKLRGKRMQAIGTMRKSLTSGRDREYVSMELTDVLSGLTIAEIEIDFEEFGKMMAGAGMQTVQYKVYGNLDKIGKKSVLKSVPIYIDMKGHYGEERHKLFKDQLEASDEHHNMILGGWELNNREYNMRNHRSDGFYPVSYIKYVEVNE